MRNPLILVAALLVVAVAVLVGPSLFEANEPPVLRWSQGDEVIIEDDDQTIGGPAGADFPPSDSAPRQKLDPVDIPTEERAELMLRGRIIDSLANPVAGARVWLGFARGGPRTRGSRRQRQVDDAVLTDREGRFAFAGATFRNLRINLTVAHDNFAPARFDRNLGEVDKEVQLGDFAMQSGAEFVGRVTDAHGNSIVSAEVRLQPQGRQTFVWMRLSPARWNQ